MLLVTSLAVPAMACFSEDTGDAPGDDDGASTSAATSASGESMTSIGTSSTGADTTTTQTADDSSAGDGATSEGSTTEGIDCELPPGSTWDEGFDRPDADDLGNCWIEKSPSVWQIVDGEVVSEGEGTTVSADHIVWRDGLRADNVEIKLELRVRSADLRNEPYALARMSDASLEPGSAYHGYALLPRATDGAEPMQLCLMRFDGGIEPGDQRCENLPSPLELGPTRHRLVLQVSGPGPVLVDGRLDVLREGDFDWSPVLTLAQWEDASPDQIATAGAVGFSGGVAIDVLDNFVVEGVQIHNID